MENMKEKILDIVERAKRSSLDRNAIEKALDLKTSGDFVRFSKLIDEMEEECLLVRNKQNKYMTRKQAGLIEGTLSLSRKGVGYIDRENEESIVIMPDDLNGAMHGDTVLVSLKRGTDTGAVRQVLKRGRVRYTGTFELTSRGLQCTVDDSRIQPGYRIRIPKDLHPIEGLKVELFIEKYEAPMRFAVERVIGHKDDPGVDITSVLLNHDIIPEFPPAVMEQANSFGDSLTEEELTGRKDLRDVITVTIDGDDSKDFDDAVSIEVIPEGWLLRVSIADVSHYVTEGSPLDQEAYERGTSVYVLDKVVPMLPHVLSNGICSLNPGTDRLTNTVEMMVARDGTTVHYEVYPSVIHSDERMTYANVNKIFDGDQELKERYAHLGSLFTDMRQCAKAIRRMRNAKGAMEFESTESKIDVDENGKPVNVAPAERGEAEMMIEDFMIAANVAVANLMKKNHIPALYRIHEEPQAKKLRSFETLSYHLGHKLTVTGGSATPKKLQEYLNGAKDLECYPVLSKMLLRCMQKAKYDPACVGHFSLAEDEYLHFTSPIRRYPDLIVHRMLRKYYFENEHSGDLYTDEANMKDYAVQSSAKERNAADAEWDVEDMKKAEYMIDRIGNIYEGIISTVTSFGFYVQLPDTVEGMVSIGSIKGDYYTFDADTYSLVGERTKKRYTIGQSVRIRVVAASKETSSIDFEVAEKTDPSKKKQSGERDRGRRFADRTRRSGNQRSARKTDAKKTRKTTVKRKSSGGKAGGRKKR